ncbi:hypothetical protein PVAND_004360 [Polypedilum vanderplanki]|uniref:Uncharacterized protein n=1 Tax=Polypedilum vanderplanki TaxID=319348 RepID=A0A9J6BXC0_POLVA|nr:hypothetical protein PVAND_004360 [Polypedilum vanderplanki]
MITFYDKVKRRSNSTIFRNLTLMQTKCKENENILQDLENLKKQINSYDNQMSEKETVLKKMEVDLINYVKNEHILLNKAEKYDKLLDMNQQLEVDIESLRKELCAKTFSLEKYKIDLQEMERQLQSLKSNEIHNDIEGHSIVEIATKLDREINYAAELDGNIIEAIKSESEMSSELDEIGSKKTDQVRKKLKNLEFELDHYKEKYKTILNELEEERKYFNDIHQQDANLIESMNLRLKLALDNEATFKKMLEHEKLKIATLSGVQRTKSFDNNILFKKSLTEFDLLFSKRNNNEMESEIVQRLKSEIKLLSSQNDCEKDRVLDLQNVVERERDRFKRTLVEQQMYIDQLKKEIQTQLNNNQLLRIELDGLKSTELCLNLKPEGGYIQEIEHLEEQNHYLIGRFMRSESFRKALVFQKILLITLSTKIGISTSSLYKIDNKKRKTFRSIAFALIAIERFKFIAKRWTGKRVMPQASHFTPQKDLNRHQITAGYIIFAQIMLQQRNQKCHNQSKINC